MKKYITFTLTIVCTCLIWIGCSNTVSSGENENTSWVFVANEGNGCWEEYGDDCSQLGTGSISMIDENGNINHIKNIGYTVNSLEVYNNKLYVIVNQDHKILTYNINSSGISIANTLIIPNKSLPREMVIINDKIYFTNWEPGDIKIMNVLNNQLEDLSIPIDGRPEDIIYDGTYIWVSIPELAKSDGNQGTKVAQIDPNTNLLIDYIEVGKGPTQLTEFNNSIFISRTYYEYEGVDDNGMWIDPQIKHGTSKISDIIDIKPYGTGSACGGSILSYNNQVYRSFGGGIAPIKDNLDINELGRLGNYQQDQVYYVEIINDNIWFCITNWLDINLVNVVNSNGQEIASYNVGIGPGDLAYWKKSE